MNSVASALFFAAAIVAGADWFAVARRLKTLEYVCKPLAAVLFVATAMALDPSDSTGRGWTVVALVLCIAGDVFLMLPRDAFVPGLASFAVAQVLFTVGFVVRDLSLTRLVIGTIVVFAGSAVLARRFIAAMRRSGRRELILPVVIYMVVISAMVIGSISAGVVVAVIGAVLFMISDSLIAEERFVRARPWHRLAVIVTYHGALAGLVLGLV